jgi:hypothetical protein
MSHALEQQQPHCSMSYGTHCTTCYFIMRKFNPSVHIITVNEFLKSWPCNTTYYVNHLGTNNQPDSQALQMVKELPHNLNLAALSKLP